MPKSPVRVGVATSDVETERFNYVMICCLRRVTPPHHSIPVPMHGGTGKDKTEIKKDSFCFSTVRCMVIKLVYFLLSCSQFINKRTSNPLLTYFVYILLRSRGLCQYWQITVKIVSITIPLLHNSPKVKIFMLKLRYPTLSSSEVGESGTINRQQKTRKRKGVGYCRIFT